MAKKYRCDALAAIHETTEALHEIGAVDKQTMREFDDACLTPVHIFASAEIKAMPPNWLWALSPWGRGSPEYR